MNIRTSMPNFWETLLEANRDRSKLWGGTKLDIGFKFIEMLGELGEWANLVKKLRREELGLPGSRTTRDKMLLELGDFMITQAIVFNELGITADDIVDATVVAFNNKSFEMNLPVFIRADGSVGK